MAVALRPALPSLIAHTWPVPPFPNLRSTPTPTPRARRLPHLWTNPYHPPRGYDAHLDPDLIVPPADVAPPSANRPMLRIVHADLPAGNTTTRRIAARGPRRPSPLPSLHRPSLLALSVLFLLSITSAVNVPALAHQSLPCPAGILSHPHPSHATPPFLVPLGSVSHCSHALSFFTHAIRREHRDLVRSPPTPPRLLNLRECFLFPPSLLPFRL